MALRSNSNRRGRSGPRETTRTREGAVRRTQMITTYGVGSMVALGDRSFIVSGLDTWNADRAERVYEPNLQHWLGVREFRLPPAASPPAGDGVRIRLFPEWYSCGTCRDLQPFGRFGSPPNRSVCGACGTALTPSRFVVACANGHLDDFPYFDWVHKRTTPSEDASQKHRLTLHSTGGSASLRSIVIKCSCGKSASLEGAFGKAAMPSIGVKCSGRRPWLGKYSEEKGCDEPPRTLQRGSSAAWFPVQRSSLSIPPWSKGLHRLLSRHMDKLAKYEDNEAAQQAVIETFIDGTGFSVAQVLAALDERRKLAGEEPDEEDIKLDASSRLRHKEYEQLSHGTSEVTRDDDFECEPAPMDPSAPDLDALDKVMLVRRLREVRALQSFTRIEMPDPAASVRRAKLSLEELDWLPAIEVSGEGVFLTLDRDRLHRWEKTSGPQSRATRINDSHSAQLLKRAQIAGRTPTADDVASPIDARFILLHTLAHALINEWSLDCGYPAAALRERIYCSPGPKGMAGILIYTATSDSAGSLGGVVGQGDPHRLGASLDSALDRISWCSQDPPCMETEAGGTDSLNLAACYACVLLPETSCETNNTFLDRALLIGTPEAPEIGFFNRPA
ncbi:DUF1998 domain-containing protein [Actinomadura sp. NPDC049382]|uniref:DUF1998 domain-containing protein n=1 Tax=Actinomadura sp. NPDC049382 TaxID=3158220 RepID=UPI00341B092F